MVWSNISPSILEVKMNISSILSQKLLRYASCEFINPCQFPKVGFSF